MKTEQQNRSHQPNNGATIPTPRFDKKAEASARQVVPLGEGDRADLRSSLMRDPLATSRITKPRWALILMLGIAATAIAAAALYKGNETTVSSDAPQKVIAGSFTAALGPPAESASLEPVRPRIEEAPTMAPRQSVERKRSFSDSADERDDSTAEERRERAQEERDKADDEREKVAKRARKEQKKILERRRKELEKRAEYLRDKTESEEP